MCKIDSSSIGFHVWFSYTCGTRKLFLVGDRRQWFASLLMLSKRRLTAPKRSVQFITTIFLQQAECSTLQKPLCYLTWRTWWSISQTLVLGSWHITETFLHCSNICDRRRAVVPCCICTGARCWENNKDWDSGFAVVLKASDRLLRQAEAGGKEKFIWKRVASGSRLHETGAAVRLFVNVRDGNMNKTTNMLTLEKNYTGRTISREFPCFLKTYSIFVRKLRRSLTKRMLSIWNYRPCQVSWLKLPCFEAE